MCLASLVYYVTEHPGTLDLRTSDGEATLGLSVDPPNVSGTDVPFELAVWLAGKGYGDHLTYSDSSAWAGPDVPTPTDCPAMAGTQACGGMCGACPTGSWCVGRGALHPVGVCVTSGNRCHSGRCPDSSERCLTFTTEPALQYLADARGYCVSPEACASIPAALPGGASCTP